jgi:hypothetical protein
VDAPHQRRRIGREIEIGTACAHSRQEAVLAQRHRLDLGGTRQGGEDDVGRRADLARRRGPDRTRREMRLGGGAADVIDDEAMARLLQVRRHAGAHGAQADESELHVFSSLCFRPRGSLIRAPHAPSRKPSIYVMSDPVAAARRAYAEELRFTARVS